MEIEQFRLFLIRGGRRISTISIYLVIYRRIERLVGFPLTREKVDKHLAFLVTKGLKPKSLNMVVNFVRLYGQCFGVQELVDVPFFKRPRYSEKATMTDEEIEAFLRLPAPVRTYTNRWGGTSTACYQKGYDIYTLFYSILAFTGMRPAELAQMTLERIDFIQQIFKLREEDVKTHTPRIVPIPPRVYDALYEYVKTLKGQYLFPSMGKGKDMMGLPCLNATDWGYNFHQRIKRLKINRKGLSVYSLRHSLITRLLDEDINLYKVQNLVGHKNIATTVMYYHSSTKALKDTVSKDPMGRRAIDPQKVLDQLIEDVQNFLSSDKRFILSTDRNTEGHLLLDIKILP